MSPNDSSAISSHSNGAQQGKTYMRMAVLSMVILNLFRSAIDQIAENVL